MAQSMAEVLMERGRQIGLEVARGTRYATRHRTLYSAR